jgi:hypothetical protein
VKWVALLGGVACAHAHHEPTALERATPTLNQAPSVGGDLHVRCEPGDAVVNVDGTPMGRCADLKGGAGLSLGPGTHHVTVEKPGYWPEERQVRSDGIRETLDVMLQPKE